jgi:hypothetical protein
VCRAGLYVAGGVFSNECPAASVRIVTEAACRAAASAARLTQGSPFAGSWPYWPKGCYYSIVTGTAFLNTDPVGAACPSYPLLCAKQTGAPQFTSDVRARPWRSYCGASVACRVRACVCESTPVAPLLLVCVPRSMPPLTSLPCSLPLSLPLSLPPEGFPIVVSAHSFCLPMRATSATENQTNPHPSLPPLLNAPVGTPTSLF